MNFSLFVESNEELSALVAELKKQYPIQDLDVYENNYAIEIKSIRIQPDARSMGYGSAIIRKIQEYAKGKNLQIMLHPEPESRKKAALHSFYKNLGFKPNKGRRMDYALSNPFGIM